MKKVAVVYWSGTGNTQAMAEDVADGARQAGAEVTLYTSDQFSPAEFDGTDAVAFGCPSMGVEELEDTEFEPMFSALSDRLTGKPIGLFGSYGWGDGEWMRTWEANCRSLGAVLVHDGVIAQDTPDDTAHDECRKLGALLAQE